MVRKFIKVKMFHYQVLSRARFPLLFTLTLFGVAMIYIIYTDNIIYDSFESGNNEIPKFLEAHERAQGQLRSSVGNMQLQLRSMQEEIDEVEDENWKSLVPPFNVKVEQRIAWFQEKMPKSKVFMTNNLTHQFHSRVREFFKSGCEEHFFMTWIAPARSFGRRGFFSLESLFKAHPTGCLMILSRSLDSRRGYRILKPLVDRGFKVNAVTPDLAFLFKNTPAEAWFKEMKSGNKDPGEIPIAQNLSNLVRLAVLYKLNNAVLIFDANHPLLLKFIEEFASSFDGNKWGHNGPYLVSRVVERIRKKPGYNFTVLPPMAFYPVDWIRINRLFQKPANQGDSIWVQDKLLQLSGETYGIHLWNKQTSNLRIEEGSVMGRLILEHCILCQHIY
nr:lactosylceramide 4-alpha-galactosyltransferase [Quercus suber]